jgi:hypothetical protein
LRWSVCAFGKWIVNWAKNSEIDAVGSRFGDFFHVMGRYSDEPRTAEQYPGIGYGERIGGKMDAVSTGSNRHIESIIDD